MYFNEYLVTVLCECFTNNIILEVKKNTIWFWNISECILYSTLGYMYLLSSPDPKGHVRYGYHLPSASSVNFYILISETTELKRYISMCPRHYILTCDIKSYHSLQKMNFVSLSNIAWRYWTGQCETGQKSLQKAYFSICF